VVGRRESLFIAIGSLALGLAIALHLQSHRNLAHFGSGFLLGVSIALLILGLTQLSRGVFRG
jgi:hypothetical protein